MSTKKIFFALLPEKTTADAISKQIKEIKYLSFYSLPKWVKEENIHLTLCFIGSIDENAISELIDRTKTITFKPFEFRLDCTGAFKKAGALWLGTQTTNENLLELANKIMEVAHSKALSLNNISQSNLDNLSSLSNLSNLSNLSSFEFKPHVTIARKLKEDFIQTRIQPIPWQVNNFYLMESVSTNFGVQYKIVHKF